MRDIVYLLRLIKVFEEFDLSHTEPYTFLTSVREYYTFTDRITPKQLEKVYIVSDNFFSHICAKQGIPKKCVVKLT